VEMTWGDLYTTCLRPCLTVEISCFEFQQRFVLLCNDIDPDSFWKFGSGLELLLRVDPRFWRIFWGQELVAKLYRIRIIGSTRVL